MKDECECGDPGAFKVNVTDMNGRIIDRVVLCQACGEGDLPGIGLSIPVHP